MLTTWLHNPIDDPEQNDTEDIDVYCETSSYLICSYKKQERSQDEYNVQGETYEAIPDSKSSIQLML